MNLTNILIIYLIIINAAAFIIFGIDKRRAVALIGGSIGALAGMRVFRHKTKHFRFVLGIPLILILQIAAAFMILKYILKAF